MIALACDHAGFELMKDVIAYLEENEIEFINLGTYTDEPCDYPDYARKLVKAIKSGECDRGILICGTGIGITIAANRYEGIRAANCTNAFMARASRLHNDANVLGLGGRVIGTGTAREILKAFLETEFSGGERHAARIAQIDKMEEI